MTQKGFYPHNGKWDTMLISEAVEAAGGDSSGWVVPDWTPELDTAVNKRFGITTAILSLTAPGACIVKDPQASAELSRKTNEYAAKLRDERPNAYGFFAALPNILNKEYALKEIVYVYDVLMADGVTLFTRYGEDNHYLGHPDFQDIWAELNRRTAVRNNPNCKIILSHAGGALPYLISRPACTQPPEELDAFWDDARNFYFDTALSGTEDVLHTLERFAKPGHILYGSDDPYANVDIINFHTSRLERYPFENPNLPAEINRGNALTLFRKLK
ncbi:hypothetical protein BDV27DRAFT_157821 [Aspergillus caelatus]|uniref:Uncharacterized protein n=1 Tax=Aspergillus caelatus TaxID=61420 RepID=A0A5N7A5H3_9EURO|nr:uncharacterized protein BDV27DRAFT_157821 [Aspergillus caelatus]KAE8364446.1 hypothetical protein BDV27DRAFT_157821 [Aspergillus caelatus]